MHLGATTRIDRPRGARYIPGLGDIPTPGHHRVETTLQRYQCERCSHECQVLGMATEPFFCPQCQHLIGIGTLATEEHP